ELRPASDDASFRRYFRGWIGGQSHIFVDAPPARENSEPFVRIASMLLELGVNVPKVLRYDLELGFMMLTDLGDRLYYDALVTGDGINSLYADAIDTILKMQGGKSHASLPAYDEALLRSEMSLFMEWFLQGQLQLEVSGTESRMVSDVFDQLVANALQQPRVFVHRDYHCRNLMVLADNNPGVIDFQDAVVGPLTYDLVSLLKDCYYRFPSAQVAQWTESFRLGAIENGTIGNIDAATFTTWFDLMGMQRHLKCAGIFSRLNLRDGKPRYLADIPLVLDYLVETSTQYPVFSTFGDWLQNKIVPRAASLRERA
ncbi:MAG: phosphotransferase, partial [Pseudomonadales bacterium]